MLSYLYSRISFYIVLLFISFVAYFLIVHKTAMIYEDATQNILGGDKRIQQTSTFIEDSLDQSQWVSFIFQSDGIFDKKNLESIISFSNEIYRLKRTSSQLGLANILVPRIIDGQLSPSFELLIPDLPYEDVDWDSIKKEASTVSYIKNIIVSENLRNSAMLYNFTVESDAELQIFLDTLDEVIKKHESESLKIYTIGLPIISKEVKDSINDNAVEKGVIAFFAIILFLIVICRRIKFLVNLLFSLTATIGACLSLMILFEVKFDYYQLLLLPFVVSIQLTFLLHYFVTYRKNEVLYIDQKTCILQTLKEVWAASLTACLTTILGFLSFLTSEIEELKTFGMLGSMFVLCALLLSYGPCLSTLLFYRNRSNDQISPYNLDHIWKWAHSKKIILTVVSAIVIVVSYLGIHFQTLKIDERAIQYLPNNSKVKKGLHLLSEEFGGIHLLTITAETGKAGLFHKMEALKFLVRLEEELVKIDKVSAVYSYAMLLTEVNLKFKEILKKSSLHLMGSHEKKELDRFDLIPTGFTLATISALLDKYNAKGMHLVIDDSRQTAKIYIRSQDVSNDEYMVLVDKVITRIKELAPEFITIKPVEGLHTFLEKEQYVKDSLVKSFVICLLPSFILLLILFKSFYFAFIALLANALAVGFMLLFCGTYGLPLNAITILAGSISFGVAVDDSIHLIKTYLKMPTNGLHKERIINLYIQKGWAVLGTSLILITCALFFVSVNFPPISNFGLMICISLVISLLVNIFILPVFLVIKK